MLQAVDRGALYVLAKAAHVGLYLLLATVVRLGVVNAFVRGYLIYGLFQLPHFGDRAWRHRLADWHGLAADEVLILSGFHAPRPWSTTACGAMACSGACCRAGLGDAPPASRRRHRPRCGATHRQWEAAMFIDRRRFGLGLASVALGAALPAAASAAGEGATVLTAGRRTLEVDGRAAPVLGITGPDGRPGLVAEVGSRFHVVMRNEIGADTLIHWHGLTPPWRQDGVPGVSAPAVAPGGVAAYDFPLAFSGTFFMHSHEGLQEQRLLAAPLIIRDPKAAGDRQEIVLTLHDFSFKAPDEILAGLRGADKPGMGGSGATMSSMAMGKLDAGVSGMRLDLNDVVYDAFLANDRTLGDPEVVRVERRGRVLLRVINASAASNFLVEAPGASATLVAVDGHPVAPISGTAFPIALAQRIDLSLDLGEAPGAVPVMATLEGERRRTGIVLAPAGAAVARLGDRADGAARPLDAALEARLRGAAPLRPKAADRVLPVSLTGDMARYAWSLNGVTYGNDVPLAVKAGERVEIVMRNDTMMSHPMHLHGHVFQVVAIDGDRFPGAMRDTVLVPPRTTITVAFDADNPGHWAFHCHNLYHLAVGMMTTLRYEGT